MTSAELRRSNRTPRGRAAFAFLLLLILLAAGAAAWWYYAPQSIPLSLRNALPASPTDKPLYKWRDAKGRVHVTDVPPTDRPYETIRVDPKTNVVPSVAPPATSR